MTTPGAISSLTNPRVKAAARLRDRRERDATGLTIVDGPRELLRAIDDGVAVVEAFVCEDLVRSDEAAVAIERLRQTAAHRLDVTAAVLGRVGFGDRPDGVVAVVRAPSLRLADLVLPADPLVVVVEGLEKPGNLGAILRTADGAGAAAVIAADPLTDLFNPNAIRASLGTIFSVPVAAASTSEVLGWLAAQAIRPVAARVGAPTAYTNADLRGSLAIVLGSEAGGLTAAWDRASVEPVGIPMLGAADSLNVSVAASILLYEARRQRGRSGAEGEP